MSDEEEQKVEITADPGPVPEEGPKRTSRPRSTKIRHVGRGRLIVVGPSGTRYAFMGHGATLKVKGEDVEALLAVERKPRGCCGSGKRRAIRPLVPA